MIDQYLIKFEKVQDETEASTLTLKQREISHSLMNKRIRKYVLKEKIERISNDLKNNYKMNIAKEFKTRQAFFLLRNSFFKPVSGTE